MTRPPKEKYVKEPPLIQFFKPIGVPFRYLTPVHLTLDEYEAIRLADHEGLDHTRASEKMGISRPTFTRLVERARRKVAQALVEGKSLIIDGGNYQFRHNLLHCTNCGFFARIDLGEETISSCPKCHSKKLQSLAKRFTSGGSKSNRSIYENSREHSKRGGIS